MDKDALQGIYNYRCLTDLIATAGQPPEEELATVAHAEFEVVANLALHDAEYSLPDEAEMQAPQAHGFVLRQLTG